MISLAVDILNIVLHANGRGHLDRGQPAVDQSPLSRLPHSDYEATIPFISFLRFESPLTRSPTTLIQ